MHRTESPAAAALRAFLLCGFSIGLLGLFALATQTPFVFPSLGATAFILIMAPTSPAASARNALGAHLVGALCGCATFHLFGLHAITASLANGGGFEHVAACSLALAATCGLMSLLGLVHPPAGATTLICSLGFLPSWWHVPVVCASVAVLTLVIRVLQRATGQSYPWWDQAGELARAPSAVGLEPGRPA
jgi:CBS domain-containing membrane protein